MNEINIYKQEDVGKFFNVRCALVGDTKDGAYTVPIIGVAHSDKQFSTAAGHYHIDGRFANKQHEKWFHMQNGRTNYVAWVDGPSPLKVIKIVFRRMKLKRLETGLNLRHSYELKQVREWAKGMEGKSCAGKKCPHLGTEMIEQNGQLICPLHNLIGCKDTEVITGIYFY